MKKQFARLAAAFGLLSIVLLGGCNNPVSPRPGVDIPAGKGVVRVETGAGAARTAAPAVSFARYEYWFSKGSDAAVEKTALDGVFELDAGSYTVTVKAFVAAEDTEPATEGTSGTFTVAAGEDAGVVRVVLNPVIGAGAGTLSFSLTFPNGAELDSLTLTRVGDGAESFDLAQAGTLEAEGDDATFAGMTVEIARREDFSGEGENLRHPYTKALWKALPQNGFIPLPGFQPYSGSVTNRCVFYDRCSFAGSDCLGPIPAGEFQG